jgi:hypothetical protein
MSLAQFVGHFIIYAGDRGLRVEFQATRLSDQKKKHGLTLCRKETNM